MPVISVKTKTESFSNWDIFFFGMREGGKTTINEKLKANQNGISM